MIALLTLWDLSDAKRIRREIKQADIQFSHREELLRVALSAERQLGQ